MKFDRDIISAPGGDHLEKQPWQPVVNKTVITVLGQAGCLTFLIAMGAFALGYWLDQQLDTAPWLTILCFTGSLPFALVLIFRLVKKGTAHLAQRPASDLPASKEETSRGT